MAGRNQGGTIPATGTTIAMMTPSRIRPTPKAPSAARRAPSSVRAPHLQIRPSQKLHSHSDTTAGCSAVQLLRDRFISTAHHSGRRGGSTGPSTSSGQVLTEIHRQQVDGASGQPSGTPVAGAGILQKSPEFATSRDRGCRVVLRHQCPFPRSSRRIHPRVSRELDARVLPHRA